MKNQRGSAVLLCSVLIASIVLLAWSVVSTWRQESASSTKREAIANAQSTEQLPPPLESKGAKASLFYPVLKARGPQPGGTLVSKPLIPQRTTHPR
jgi:hypothetical protein